MRTAVNLLADPSGVSLRIPGRAEHRKLAPRAVGTTTLKPPPNMGVRPSQHQPPAVLQGVVHRGADVLVLVIVHVDTTIITLST